MTERKVKGSLLAIQARFIRANKDKDWDKFLQPEDWEIINGRVLPSVWYPLETFERCGMAVSELMAGGDMGTIRSMGKLSVDMLAKDIYKTIASTSDPVKIFERFMILVGRLFNYGEWNLEEVNDTHIKIHYHFGGQSTATDLYCHLMMGAFDQLLEMAGGKNGKAEFAAREWAGDPKTIFDIQWE